LVKLREDITPWLNSLSRQLDDLKPSMAEAGELMTTKIRESHNAQRGLADGVEFKSLEPASEKAKERKGGNPARVLFMRGNMFGSWRRIRTTKTLVQVGAGASGREAKKASRHDDRLRIGWNDKLHGEIADGFLGDFWKRVKDKSPKKL